MYHLIPGGHGPESGGKTSDSYDKFPEAIFLGGKSCQSFATQIHFNQKNSGGVGHLHCSSNMIGTPPKNSTFPEHQFLNVTICWEWHSPTQVNSNPILVFLKNLDLLNQWDPYGSCNNSFITG